MSQELAAIGSLHRSAEREQAAAHRLESKQQALEDMITSYRRDYEVILPASLAPVLEVTP